MLAGRRRETEIPSAGRRRSCRRARARRRSAPHPWVSALQAATRETAARPPCNQGRSQGERWFRSRRTSRSAFAPASATTCLPASASKPYGFESTSSPVGLLVGLELHRAPPPGAMRHWASRVPAVPAWRRLARTQLRASVGSPPKPIVNIRFPRPCNERSLGPMANICPSSVASDGSPVTTSRDAAASNVVAADRARSPRSSASLLGQARKGHRRHCRPARYTTRLRAQTLRPLGYRVRRRRHPMSWQQR